MSLGFGFALPAYPLRGGGGNNPFNQSGPTLDLSFVDGATNVGDLSNPNGYTLNTNFITPQYQVAAQYVVWETGVGLVDKTFSQIITFSRASGATWFNSAGVNVGIDFSTSSVTIGTGSKTFTLDATAGIDRSWAAGDIVRISEQATPANFMDGTVTSYTASTQTLVVNVTATGGSGTIASWRVSNWMPRFDYNPSTLAAQGFLVEEARTNSIRNNTMQGAVAGTPGTLPTNWGTLVNTTTGLTTSVVGTGTENGVTYIDIRLNGTATGAGSWDIYFEPASGVSALTGQTWTGSLYWKLQAGSTTGLSSPTYYLYEFTSGIAFIVAQAVSLTFPTGAALNTQRPSATMTLNGGATTAFARPLIKLNIANGAAIDITLRIGLPQLENNNISTGVASATVAAGGSGYAIGDVLQIVGGTGSTAARLTVATLSGSAVATVTVSTAGSYSVFPSPQPVSVTAITGTGTSATFNIVPQTQTGFATSVIPTTTTALTRNADVASVNTLSPWYNQTEGTLFAEYVRLGATNFQAVAYLGTPAQTDYAGLVFGSGAPSNNQRFDVGVGGLSQASITVLTTPALNTVSKTAGAYKANDFAATANGAAPGVDPNGSIPTVTALGLGTGTALTGPYLNGYLRRITYYPTRLSNAQLQAITA